MAFGVEELLEALEGPPVGLVVHLLAALVDHHVALVVELLLGDGGEQVPHAVGLQPQPQVELVGGQHLVVVGAVEPGRAVGDAPRLLHEAEVVVGADVLAALEQHVLEQMGESGAAGSLVLRADVVPDVDRRQGQRRIAVQHHPQAVGQGVALELEGAGGEPLAGLGAEAGRMAHQGWGKGCVAVGGSRADREKAV